MARGKICAITSRNMSSRVCPVDFDGRREMSSLSLKTVVDHKSVSYIAAVAACWTKSLKFTLSIAIHRGGLAKNHFWLAATQKKRIGEQLNYFWNMCPKPFLWTKIKENFFSDEKSRGPLLARAALKIDMTTKYFWPPIRSFVSHALKDNLTQLGKNSSHFILQMKYLVSLLWKPLHRLLV